MSENLRDRYAEALREAAFLDIATEHNLTILPTEHGAQVPPHWSTEADLKADPYLDAVLAVRDDVLAEKDERLRRANRRGEHLLARAEAAEAEVARLRGTVGRAWSAWLGVMIDEAFDDGTSVLEWVLRARPDLAKRLRAALAPRPSASEAPRTRDGEQGGER